MSVKFEGEYFVYKDGLLVAQQKNLITAAGGRLLLRYIAGNLGTAFGSIAVGTVGTAATTADTKLGFEFGRTPVDVKAPDFINNKIIFKGTLPATVAGRIYEIGIYPYMDNPRTPIDNAVITTFDSSVDAISGGTFDTTIFRIGTDSYKLTAATSATATAALTRVRAGLDGYNQYDSFVLAYQNNDTNNATMRVRMMTTTADYYTYTFTPNATVGYWSKEWLKSDFTTVGSPNWATLTRIEIDVVASSAGATTVNLDGLNIINNDVYPDYALMSHSILTTPLAKSNVEKMDIEWQVGMTTA